MSRENEMRSIAAAVLLTCIPFASFAQGSLCNPCVDPPLDRSRERSLQIVEPAPRFNLGASVSALRSLNGPDSDGEALLEAARAVMPSSMMDVERAVAVRDGLWRKDRQAVAVTVPRTDATLVFVFVLQTDGSYAGTDATPVISQSAFGSFGWPAEAYERYAITLFDWETRDGNPAVLRAYVAAWRQGQRYSTLGSFFVSPDGSITNP